MRVIKTRSYGINGLRVFRPSTFVKDREAVIEIAHSLHFNEQWDDARVWRNRVVGSLFVGEKAVLLANSFVFHSGCKINVNDGACLELGSGYANYDCVIDCYEHIKIGKDVKISERVCIRDSDNHHIVGRGRETVPIVIGDKVWIGMNVTILKGVHVGEGAIIAAGSVVIHDVPAHTMVAGVPAIIVKTDVHYE